MSALSDFNDHGADAAKTAVAKALVPANLIAVPLDHLATSEHKPHPFAVWPIIPALVVTLLAAHGGAGKSYLALVIAAHFACGRDFGHFRIDEPGRALFVSLEDAGELVRFRLRRIAAAYDLPIETLQRRLTIVDGTAGDGTIAIEYNGSGTRELIPTATHDELANLAAGHGLIVVDNVSDGFAGNENDRRQVRTFMRMLTTIARNNNAGVLLLAHVDKATARFGSASDRYSGSTAWHNSARSRLDLIGSNGTIELQHAKFNLTKQAAPMVLAWSTDGVLVPAEAANAPGHDHDADALAAALVAADRAGVMVPTARTGPATAQHVLTTLPEFPAGMRGVKGRPAFWLAIAGLQRAGRLHTVDYISPSRHKRERFALVSCAALSPTPPAQEPALGRGPCAGFEYCDDSQEPAQTGALAQCTPDAYRRAKDGEP